MSEKLKFALLLIVLVIFSVFEIAYIAVQVKAILAQRKAPVRVFPKGALKYSSIFSFVVGLTMIYTFIISDSFIYNNSNAVTNDFMTLGYKLWHSIYTFGKFTGVIIIAAAVLSFFNRFAIDTNAIITSNGTSVPAKSCMMAKAGNIVTVTHRPNAPALPYVLVKFDASTESGKKALAILEENYSQI